MPRTHVSCLTKKVLFKSTDQMVATSAVAAVLDRAGFEQGYYHGGPPGGKRLSPFDSFTLGRGRVAVWEPTGRLAPSDAYLVVVDVATATWHVRSDTLLARGVGAPHLIRALKDLAIKEPMWDRGANNETPTG